MEVVILKPARGSLSTYQRIIMEAHLEAMTSKKVPDFFWWSMWSHGSLTVQSQLRKLILENLSGMSWLARKMIQCLSRKKQFLYGMQAIWCGIIFKHFESPYDIVTSCQIISGHILLKYRSYCVKYHESCSKLLMCTKTTLRCPSCKSSWFMRLLRSTQRLGSLAWENLWSVSVNLANFVHWRFSLSLSITCIYWE